MHVIFLVEEPSCEAALHALVPRILPASTFETHPFQGKPDLLSKLDARLRGYGRWIKDDPRDCRVVVLIDEDRQDCRALKARLEGAARQAGLTTRATAAGGKVRALTRIAVEELEAWFFGDVEALVAAYPRVTPHLARRPAYRDSDAIRGGTWEALERVLQRAKEHLGGLEKVRAAREIAAYMAPSRNRSKSFQAFRAGLLGL